jgi:hypothetical protein
MAVDDEYIKRFEEELELLKRLEKEIGAAILRANDKLVEMQKGEKK